jgi:mitogen-activated protein kinase 1/3
MLVINPNKRYNVEECLNHPYLEGMFNSEEIITSETLFDWSFDDIELTKENLQSMIYEESLNFNEEDE